MKLSILFTCVRPMLQEEYFTLLSPRVDFHKYMKQPTNIFTFQIFFFYHPPNILSQKRIAYQNSKTNCEIVERNEGQKKTSGWRIKIQTEERGLCSTYPFSLLGDWAPLAQNWELECKKRKQASKEASKEGNPRPTHFLLQQPTNLPYLTTYT